jgi:hypothetical protein
MSDPVAVSVSGPLVPMVEKALANLPLLPSDVATVKLAYEYAKAIDGEQCWECGGKSAILTRLGPKLLDALDKLGATPTSKVIDREPSDPEPKSSAEPTQNRLTALRSARPA